MAHSLLSFSASAEEKAIIKSIAAKHAPEEHEYEVMPIMGMIEDIFYNSIFKSAKVPEIHRSIATSSSPAKKVDWLENIHCTINYLSCKISCDCKKGLDLQPIFDLLEKFSWEVKVVLVLAAFAMSYGEFWLNISVTENPLLQLVSALKQPQWLHGSALPAKFPLEALAILIKSTLDLAHRLIQLKEYCAEFQTQFEVQVACYRIIKSAVLCHSYSLDLLKKGTQYTVSTAEIQTLETYTREIKKISVFLNEQLEKFYIIEEENAFSTSTDITIRIQKFFVTKDSLPLWHGSRTGDKITISKVGVDLLKGQSVGLFISEIDFDVNLPEFNILVETYKKIKEHKSRKDFEIIWIPMVDKSIQWSAIKDITYDRGAKMPWDLFCDPTTIKTSFTSYIRKSWHFQKKPILVVLDSKGNVSCTNAIPMVTIWGDSAYPFTSSTEGELWKGMSWNVQTLVERVNCLDASIVINQEKLVCFYGGDDLDWIRKFAQKVKQTGIPIELIYIGINGRREKLQKILAAFAKESISKYWTEETILSFWFRFQCMFNFRMQHGKSTSLMEDSILKELMTILTYDSTDHGWAMIFKGSHDIVKASGKQLTQILERFQEWGKLVHEPADLLPVINREIINSQSYVHCAHTMIPMTGWFDPGNMSCLICGRPMERYYLYKCCIEEDKKENGFSIDEEEDGF